MESSNIQPQQQRPTLSVAIALLFLSLSACTSARRAERTVAAAVEAYTPSTPVISREDLDTTVTPCEDFHQYAAGGWYRRTPKAAREELRHGPDQGRAGRALRELVARAPALARSTREPALAAVGMFYGSCLTDLTGTAPGTVGDTTRASYCFRTTRQYLDRALFELLMEHVWLPTARAESRRFWPHIKAGAAEWFQASQVLSDSTKQQLVAMTDSIKMYASEAPNNKRNNMTELWRRDPVVRRAGLRGPSDVPFIGATIAATWSYRDYISLALSPTDFRHNVTQLQAAPDSIPLPAFPSPSQTASPLAILDVLLSDKTYDAGVGYFETGLPLGMLIFPIVDGQIDIGAWYGTLGPVTGHEMSHGTWQRMLFKHEAELRAFTEEQFHGQLANLTHPLDDAIGVMVAYNAFRHATRGRSWPAIDGFTVEQRFFLGVARSWYGGMVGFRKIDPIENGQTRARVLTNGILSALPAFAQAFWCRPGDPMAGGHIWHKDPWYRVTFTPEQRREFYQANAFEAMDFFDDQLGKNLKLTPTQQTAHQQLQTTIFTSQWRVFFDSLASVSERSVGNQRALNMVAQYMEDVRELLSPDQHDAFKRVAQAWREQFTVHDAPVAVPPAR